MLLASYLFLFPFLRALFRENFSPERSLASLVLDKGKHLSTINWSSRALVQKAFVGNFLKTKILRCDPLST